MLVTTMLIRIEDLRIKLLFYLKLTSSKGENNDLSCI
jgi:hypothetical protein